jgi:hypothetical protein
MRQLELSAFGKRDGAAGFDLVSGGVGARVRGLLLLWSAGDSGRRAVGDVGDEATGAVGRRKYHESGRDLHLQCRSENAVSSVSAERSFVLLQVRFVRASE